LSDERVVTQCQAIAACSSQQVARTAFYDRR